MNKKISVGLVIAIVVVVSTAVFAITLSVSQYEYNKLLTNLPSRSEMYSSIEELDTLVRKNYYGTVDDSLRNSKIADGYLKGLNDKYSYYMTASQYDAYSATMNGKSSGIGISATEDEETGYIYVSEVYPDSPAEEAGLKKGNLISAVEGEDVTKSNYDDMIDDLSGNKLTGIKISYISNSVLKTTSVAMGYTTKSVSSQIIQNVVHIKISGFYMNTADQLKDILDGMDKDTVGIIFDVRGTDSGSIEYACKALDLIVPVPSEGTQSLATAIDSSGKSVESFTSDSSCISLPVTVLIDSDTSGAAELFACDLHDFGMAELIGENTQGNGNLQKIFELSDGSAVVLSVAKITPYTSQSYDGKGLTPDYKISLTSGAKKNLNKLSLSADPQLRKALYILTE